MNELSIPLAFIITPLVTFLVGYLVGIKRQIKKEDIYPMNLDDLANQENPFMPKEYRSEPEEKPQEKKETDFSAKLGAVHRPDFDELQRKQDPERVATEEAMRESLSQIPELNNDQG